MDATSAAAVDVETPAPAAPAIVRRMPVSLGIAAAAAVILVGFALTEVDAPREAMLVGSAIVALAVGHAFLRTRAWRLRAEAELARSRAEQVLQTKVGDCEQRRKSLAAFAQLAAHVAHEVRNPLSAIMLNAELLEEEAARCNCEGAEESRALIGSIRSEAERLQHLTDEYLAFARPPRRCVAYHNLNAVADDLAHLVRTEAARSNIIVETRMSHECPCTVFDSQQMKQALLNLVRNAIQAMPDGGRLVIETSIRSDGRVAIAVEDSGPGVADDQRCRIFEPFFTTKSAGTGLGLPLALHIVRDHDGEIECEHAVGGGARFAVVLPSVPADVGSCHCPPEREGALATA